MISFKNYLLRDEPKGTYAGLSLDEESRLKIGRFIALNNIVNALPISELHSTVIYSDVHCPRLKDTDICISASVVGLKLIESDNKQCLTLKLHSPEQIELHDTLRKQHGANHGFPDYVPHITLTYDFVGKHLPIGVEDIGTVTFNHLQVKELDKSWTL